MRHGETVGNLEKIAHGQSESPLNDRGIRQAQHTAEMLREWDTVYHRVYTSPLSRAHHTGQHIAEALGLPIDTHDDLVEGFLGDWEGITYQELDEVGFAKHSIRDDDFRGHNGESPNQLADRMACVLEEIRAQHPGENIIFVSHGAAIAHLLARLMDTTPAFGHQYIMHNSAVTEITFHGDDDKPELSTLNFHEHLPEDLKMDPMRRDRKARTRAALLETADELTNDWLQKVMSPHLDGATIAGFSPQVIGVGEGFMGQLARLAVTYTEDTGTAPRSLIAKFAATRADTREMARDQNLYRREIGFYRDIGQDVGIRVPVCYYSDFNEETQSFVMLLEDMAPGEASDQVLGTSKETSRQVIEHFARLHAKWWNSDKLDGYVWAKWIINEMPMEEALARLRENTRQVEETGSFDAYPEMKRLMYLLPPLFRMQPAPPYPFSLTHGDLRSDNIIQPSAEGGEFCVLDWQLAGKGDPVNDIARWMAQSITIEDRRETEQELLKLYHGKLIEHGVTGYSYKAFINAYKMNLIVILVMFSMSIDSVDRSSDRAKALFHQFYSRLDSALLDWELEKLLKVLPLLVPFIKFSTWLKMLLKPKSNPSNQ
ncbi:MAG: histidine phosphatase family protein [Gammaproteobacteria bacterium]|nr:histidine phosphatase family protein [Gammaproteobacteria bacterium]